MGMYEVNKSFTWEGELSEKAVRLCRMFGLSADGLRKREVKHNCQLKINDGDIVYITGPSGAGKSVILGEIEKQIPQDERINLSQVELSAERFVIDCIECRAVRHLDDKASLSGGGILDSLAVLNTCGLNDVYCALNRPAFLSEGQKQRFRLAVAICAGRKFIIADEFCSQLDRITAAVISYNVRRFASKYKVTFLLSSCQDDILMDLQPDVLVIKELSGGTEVIYKDIEKSDK